MFSGKRERSGADLLPDAGEAFTERLNMLASTVSSTAAALARTDGEIAGLRRDLGNGLARLEELVAEMRSRARAGDVRELEKKVDALTFERARTSDSRRLDDVGAKVAVLAERVDTLAQTVSTTAASAARRDGEVAALRRRVGEAPRDPGDAARLRRLEDVAAASASASLRLDTLGSHVTELAARVDTREREVEPALEELRRAAGALDGRLAVLETRRDDLAREDVESRLRALAERIDAIEAEHVTASSVAEAASVRWREVERWLGALSDRLTAVEERVASASATLDRTAALWPAALRSLESRLDRLEGAARPAAPARDGTRRREDGTSHGAPGLPDSPADAGGLSGGDEPATVQRRLERLTGRPDETPELAEVVPFRSDR
jgi:chromosome segregation ATPase